MFLIMPWVWDFLSVYFHWIYSIQNQISNVYNSWLFSLYRTDSWNDATSANFNSTKIHEDKIFGQQGISQFFSGHPKITNMQNPQTPDRHFNDFNWTCNLIPTSPGFWGFYIVCFCPSPQGERVNFLNDAFILLIQG